MTSRYDWIDHLGSPIPCEVCRTPTPAGDLTQCWVPGYLIEEWDVVVQRAVYVCPSCPVVG
jgi:hypothetical protein